MTDLKPLRDEIDALEKVQAQLADISKEGDQARRNELVELRRNLAAQIGKVGAVADPIFSGLADRQLTEAYRSKFSRMRSAAATHQANWPAVLMGQGGNEYGASAQKVRDANRDFVTWMRETIASLERRR